MLLRIFASNFLSFKDSVEFSFAAKHVKNNNAVFFIEKEYGKRGKKYAVNKVSAIYWANASWKTNLLKIIKFIKEMILFSHNQNFLPSHLWYKPYLLNTEQKNSEFWVDFFIDEILYSYYFIIDSKTDKILEETLLEYKSQKATTLYKRKLQHFTFSESFSAEWKNRKDFVRENSLALSVFSNMSWEISSKIRKFFLEKVHIFQIENNIHWIPGQFNMNDTITMIDKYSQDFWLFLQKFLLSADININKMDYKIEEKSVPGISPNNEGKIRIFTNSFNRSIYDNNWNKVEEINFTPDLESTWTNRLVSLSGSLYNVIKHWMTLFIDELDSSLHPLLLKEIVKAFNSQRNILNWQLIFTSHDVSLLNDPQILPRDQIWFVDKNIKWESTIYSLDDYKGLNNRNIETDYLLWRFDAIPHTKTI